MIEADFKHTPESTVKKWIERFVDQHNRAIINVVDLYQNGDYHNDWVRA